jgi:hypothetical protein
MGKQDELRSIGKSIEDAAEYGLEAEVVYTALHYMKEDTNLTPSQAIQLGLEEWIK